MFFIHRVWLSRLLCLRQTGLAQNRWRPAERGSGMKDAPQAVQRGSGSVFFGLVFTPVDRTEHADFFRRLRSKDSPGFIIIKSINGLRLYGWKSWQFFRDTGSLLAVHFGEVHLVPLGTTGSFWQIIPEKRRKTFCQCPFARGKKPACRPRRYWLTPIIAFVRPA